MTAAIAQKLLAGAVVLTCFYMSLIFVVQYDLTRKTNNSILNLLPGIIVFCFGIATVIFFNNPTLIFKKIFPIKSGFARSIVSTTIFPIISASIRTMCTMGGISMLIDKMWFYWRKNRIFFVIRELAVVYMIIVGGNTLFKIIFTDQPAIIKTAQQLKTIGLWSGTILGTLLLLVTIMALPTLFAKKKPESDAPKEPDNQKSDTF